MMSNICRTCLKVSDHLKNIFEDNTLPHKIKVISSVQVSVNDSLPVTICDQCVRNTHLLYDFRCIIIRSNITLIEKQKNSVNNKVTFFEAEGILLVQPKEEIIEEAVTVSIKEHNSEEEHIDEMHKPYVKNAIEKANERKLSARLHPMSKPEHRKEHRNFKKSICSTCGVTVMAMNLKKHILIHTELPVKCKECGKTCKNSESLRGHMFTHKGIKLECKICYKVYKHRAAFRAHKRRHELGDVKTVPCNICAKLFYDKQVLQKHIRSHTGERPYLCKFCNKGFSSIHARNIHTRQHTNEKPYACQFCKIAFPQKVSLKTHIKSKHPTETETLLTL
ncbi:hypothetical protein RN001_002536 [Aquatica leii]|uniref:Uncharacterized protein n=1 Tax=Aquatica leii TaxID=1421715 RepID=A0AAN7QB58_9COLE|nr:hypothetical protein RN001_002536 [Aquatica leii]